LHGHDTYARLLADLERPRAVGFFALTVVLGAVLRNAAPHVAIPATKKSALAEPLATAA